MKVLAENEEGEKVYQEYSSASKRGKTQSKVIEGFELEVEDISEA